MNECLNCGKVCNSKAGLVSHQRFCKPSPQADKPNKESQQKLQRLQTVIGEIKKGMPTQEELRLGLRGVVAKQLKWQKRTPSLRQEYLNLVNEIYPDKKQMHHIDFLRERGNLTAREAKPKRTFIQR